MVTIAVKPIQVNSDEVLRAKGIYPKNVDALPVIAKINREDYALIQEGDKANVTISMSQRFNGMNLKFFPMLQEAMKTGEALATPRYFMQNLIEVNSAIRGEIAIYDALGNIIERDRLVQYARGLNHNRWAYLNGRFPQGGGFKGLDFITVEADGRELREPLKPCLEQDCYAEINSINSQGLLTQRASVQRYKPGETIYFCSPVLREDNPEEGYVARFVAYPDYARVLCSGHPGVADASLGGILCAEGAVAKNLEVKQ